MNQPSEESLKEAKELLTAFEIDSNEDLTQFWIVLPAVASALDKLKAESEGLCNTIVDLEKENEDLKAEIDRLQRLTTIPELKTSLEISALKKEVEELKGKLEIAKTGLTRIKVNVDEAEAERWVKHWVDEVLEKLGGQRE